MCTRNVTCNKRLQYGTPDLGLTKFHRYNEFRLALINARSIINKWDELIIWAARETCDLIAVTETWLHDDVRDCELQLPGYNLYRQDRNGSHHGGVLLYVADALTSSQLGASADVHVHCEQLWCSVQRPYGPKTVFGVVYRSPDNEDDNWMALMEMHCKHPRVCVMGDFNCPNVNWTAGICLPAAKRVEHLLFNTAVRYQLHQHVMEHTRHEVGQRSSCLDLVFTSPALNPTRISVQEPLGGSDHAIVLADLPGREAVKESTPLVPNYWNINHEAVRLHAA